MLYKLERKILTFAFDEQPQDLPHVIELCRVVVWNLAHVVVPNGIDGL